MKKFIIKLTNNRRAFGKSRNSVQHTNLLVLNTKLIFVSFEFNTRAASGREKERERDKQVKYLLYPTRVILKRAAAAT